MKITTFVSAAILSIASLAAANGNVAVGVEGLDRDPSLRINLDDRTALNLVPDLNFSHNDNLTVTTLGLDLGLLVARQNLGDLKFGPRIDLGINWEGYDQDGTPNTNYTTFGAGLGWDLEYFIPAVNGLSVGANASLAYTFSNASQSGFSSVQSHSIGLNGNVLCVRYYF